MTRRRFFLFVLPWVVSFAVFTLYPFCYSFVLSFLRFDPVSAQKSAFVGVSNYQRALGDELLRRAFLNTVLFVVGTVPVTTVLSFVLGRLLMSTRRAGGVFRSGFFLPSVVSMVAVALVFKQLYAPDGSINRLLGLLGIPGESWLLDPRWALPSIMLMDVWASVGYYAIIYLAALESIPGELFEAAALDGGGVWRTTWSVMWPLVGRTTVAILIINSIRSLQVFIEVFVMTQGGPLNSTLTAVLYLYDRAFHHFELGYASTVAYLVFLVALVLSLLQLRYVRIGQRRSA